MKTIKCLAAAVLVGLACATVGCDQSALLPEKTAVPSPAAEEPTITPLPTEALPTHTAVPTAAPTATLAPVVTREPATEASQAPVPLRALEESGSAELTGDGRRDTILRAEPSAAGTIQLMLNGCVYDTAVPAGGEATFYVADINADGVSEIICVQREGRGGVLRVFRLTQDGLSGAVFTYTVPAELSPSGTEEYRDRSDTLIFSGIEPIVALGDGSFAVLSFGSGFQRYILGSDMHVTEAGSLPVDILTGGDIPAVVSTADVSAAE